METKEYYQLVARGLDILRPCMAGYIGQKLHRDYEGRWWDRVLSALSDQYDLPTGGSYADLVDSLDVANCLRLLDRCWNDIFRRELSTDYRTWSKEVMGIRNKVAHMDGKGFSQSDAERYLDTMARLCGAFDEEEAEEIRKLYRKVRYGNEEGTAAVTSTEAAKSRKATAAVLSRHVGEDLPSWRDVMQPHPDVAMGRYQSAEFAADLAQVARGEGSIEYRDPKEFFARTYITEGMAGLLVQSLQRLSGSGGEPVIQLKTAFGGGKTHSMLALYHIARGGMSASDTADLLPILQRAGLDTFPRAHVAVLVGTALDPTQRKRPINFPGYSVGTLWGEMARQLVTAAGRPELYGKYIQDSDKKGVSPGSEQMKALFDECGPCLVLIDELVAYARKIYGVSDLPAGSFENLLTFIQEITEAAKASKNSLVVASIPESNIEIGGEGGQRVLEAITHTFGRVESIWKPVAANEGFEVVRRRLFLKCKNEEARDYVCTAFSQMYREGEHDFPSETREEEYRRRLISCYPIHPEVFDRLYDDWATLERFQRTRGVLRLMAAVIHELWMANDAGALIMPGSITLDMPHVRDELTRYLPETWNSIIDREIDGRNSIPYQKDQSSPRYGRILACRRVARTVMLGSAPGTFALRKQGLQGLEMSRILLGTVQPGESIADFRDALNTLRGALSYLYTDTGYNRFWYDTKPTLLKTAQDRASQQTTEEVDREILRRLRTIRREAPFEGIHACPASSGDVPDRQEARLVVLPPAAFHRRSGTSPALEKARTILNTHGSGPRYYRNMLTFAAADEEALARLRQDVRQFLAWSSIVDDTDTLNLDAHQSRQAKDSQKDWDARVNRQLNEAYCWLLTPYSDPYENQQTLQWDIHSIGGGTNTIAARAAAYMQEKDLLITRWSPAILQMTLDEFLWADKDALSLKQIWDCLTTYCYLPRLANYGVFENAVRAGLPTKEFFGLASQFENGRYVNLRWNQSVMDIYATDLLVKPGAVLAQLAQEQPPTPAAPAVPTSAGIPKPGPVRIASEAQVPEKPRRSSHFSMDMKVNPVRVNKDISTCVEEILEHLMKVDGAKVTITFSVDVDAPGGIPEQTERIVSENCRTLKIEPHFYK